MAEIFYAERHGAMSFRRPVCIKRIRPALCADTNFVQMFIDEAHTTSKLRHSNIVAVEDFGSEEGQLYLCMEWIHGIDAARLLKELERSARPMPIDVALHLTGEVLKGLDYAHRKTENGKALEIVHRDISPHNVMVSYVGEVKITDFGIAKAASRVHQTQGDMVKGKLAYMAPEQATGKAIDGRADVFAVGVMLYELITGRRPFVGRELEVVTALMKGDRPRVHALRSDVEPAVEAFVDRMLEVDRERRFGSAAEALEVLPTLPVATGSRNLARLLSELYPDQVSVVTPTGRSTGVPEAPASSPSAPSFGVGGVERLRTEPLPNNDPTATGPRSLSTGPTPVATGPVVATAPLSLAAPAPARNPMVYAMVAGATMALTTLGIVMVVKLTRPSTPAAAAVAAPPVAAPSVAAPPVAAPPVAAPPVAAPPVAAPPVAAPPIAAPPVAAPPVAAPPIAAPPVAVPQVQYGTIVLRVRPYADSLRVDGRAVQEGQTLRLTAGNHTAVATQNPTRTSQGRSTRQTFRVRPGDNDTVVVSF